MTATRPDQLRDGLLRQITAPVRWAAAMTLLLEQGVDSLYELGPGKVLAGLLVPLAHAAGTTVRVHSLGAPADPA